MLKNAFFNLFFNTIHILIDFVTIVSAIIFSYNLYWMMGIGKHVYYEITNYTLMSVFASFITVVVMHSFGVYKKESSLLNVEEIKNTVKGITVSFMLFGIVLVFGKILLSRYVLLFSYFFTIFFVVMEKMILYNFVPMPVKGLHKKILIYGSGELGQALYREIVNSPRMRIVPIGFVDDDPARGSMHFHQSGYTRSGSINVLGTGDDILRLKDEHDVDEVYIAISNIEQERLIKILSYLKSKNITAYFVPNLYRIFVHKIRLSTIGNIPVVKEEERKAGTYLYFKNKIDVFFSVVVLLITWPLFLLIALWIKLDSKGSILFIHDRVGKDGKKFKLYKFRTMFTETNPYEVNPMSHDDPRITRAGRFLRRTSLDELPQLINILKGEMSFVGPRPEMPFIVEEYDETHMERLKVLPGVTGLWQLSGDRDKPIHYNMDYDLYYIKNISFFLDITIVINTFFFALRGI